MVNGNAANVICEIWPLRQESGNLGHEESIDCGGIAGVTAYVDEQVDKEVSFCDGRQKRMSSAT